MKTIIEDFWIRCYLGSTLNTDFIHLAINRAYRDLNRTIHGMKNINPEESKRNYADASLRLRLLEEIGWHINMFAEGSTHTRGRKAQEQIILDYGNPMHLHIALALLKAK